MRTFGAAVCLVALIPAGRCFSGEPPTAVTIRFVKPDQQVGEIIDLFQGAKAPHPAAALAAWKRASREPDRLGKPLEALIAAINPKMAGELRTLDGAEVAIRFEPGSGRLTWNATLPKDDGTFASLATALVLSGGATEDPLGKLPVDRLGPPGSPLMAKSPRGLLVAGDRAGLDSARERSEGPARDGPLPGVDFFVDGEPLAASKSLTLRRISEALRASHNPILWGNIRLADSSLEVGARGGFGRKPDDPPRVEPDWLDWVPADRAMAAFAVAIDPNAENWDTAFRLTDRVERVDPLRADMAPLRLRLALLARGVGVRAESDVLPHLKGMSGWIGSGGKAIDRGLVAFHLRDEGAAGRLFSGIKPPGGPGKDPGIGPEGSRFLGWLDGRPLQLFRVGSTILLAWGDGSLDASLASWSRPGESAGASLRRGWLARKPSCAGGIWPGRLPGLVPDGSPLSMALVGALPVTWKGGWDDLLGNFGVEVSCTDLNPILHRFLALIPLDPPPDR